MRSRASVPWSVRPSRVAGTVVAMRRLGIVLCVGALACAKGGDGPDAGGGRLDAGRRDTGGRDAARQDAGRDAGRDAAPACVDDEVGDTCAEAVDLGTVEVGGMVSTVGKLPMLTDSDWYSVRFPPADMPGAPGGGTPSVVLEGDSTMAFRVELDCGSMAGCGEGAPRDLTSYTFTDDPPIGTDPVEPGEEPNDYSTRDVPWPTVLHIRVARRGGPVDCSDYTLTITR